MKTLPWKMLPRLAAFEPDEKRRRLMLFFYLRLLRWQLNIDELEPLAKDHGLSFRQTIDVLESIRELFGLKVQMEQQEIVYSRTNQNLITER